MSNGRSPIPVFLVLVLLIAGGVAWIIFRPKPAVPVPTVTTPSHDLDIDVYLDGTKSIRNVLSGSAKSKGQNYLHDLLTKCESVLSNPETRGWANENVYLWKFGEKIEPLAHGDLTLMADSPRQANYFNAQNTSIELAALDDPQKQRKSERSELKIIITDLYQSDGASEKVVDPLTKRYLTGGKGAIAVIGVRNPYPITEGVDDLHGPYGGAVRLPPGSADSMPIYVIIAGDQAADVRIARRLLMDAMGLKTSAQSVQAFSAYFSKLPDSDDEHAPVFHRNEIPGSKPRDTGTVTESSMSDIPMLSWRKGKVNVSWTSPLSEGASSRFQGSKERTLVSTDAKVTPVVEIANEVRVTETGPDGKKITRHEIRQEPSPEAVKAVVDTSFDSDSQSFTATIDRSNLSSGRVYLFRFDVVAQSPTSIFGPAGSFMKRWNTEDSEEKTPKMFAKDPAIFPGVAGDHPGRTPNLSKILSAFQGQMFHVNTDPVRTATYYLYVKAR